MARVYINTYLTNLSPCRIFSRKAVWFRYNFSHTSFLFLTCVTEAVLESYKNYIIRKIRVKVLAEKEEIHT